MNKDYFVIMGHHDFYDGPLTGIGIYKGEIVHFDCVDETDDRKRDRTFALSRMSHQELVDVLQWGMKFVQSVGFHNEYDLYTHKRFDMWPYGKPAEEQDMMEVFYEPYRKWAEDRTYEYPKREFIVNINDNQLYGKEFI